MWGDLIYSQVLADISSNGHRPTDKEDKRTEIVVTASECQIEGTDVLKVRSDTNYSEKKENDQGNNLPNTTIGVLRFLRRKTFVTCIIRVNLKTEWTDKIYSRSNKLIGTMVEVLKVKQMSIVGASASPGYEVRRTHKTG